MISVIIPTLDEAGEIPGCLRGLGRSLEPFEVVVVDGGSRDQTRALAEAGGARVLTAPRGRARQMNRGAAAAEGDLLLFLHADMRLPEGGLRELARAMEDPAVPGGGFYKRYVPGGIFLGLMAWAHNVIRADLFRAFVGTNAMFVRRGVFEAVGGFPEVPFLEDVILSDRLLEVGPVAVIRDRVSVSSRKYARDGVWTRTLRNLWIMGQFRFLGKTPEELVRQYR